MTDICRNLGHARASYYRRAAPKAIDANAVKLRAAVRDYTFAHIHARQVPALLVTHDPEDVPDGGRVFEIGEDGDVTHV